MVATTFSLSASTSSAGRLSGAVCAGCRTDPSRNGCAAAACRGRPRNRARSWTWGSHHPFHPAARTTPAARLPKRSFRPYNAIIAKMLINIEPLIGRCQTAIRRFSGFPAASLPRLRFDRRVACKVLIRNDFRYGRDPKKNFSLSFPERQGRGGATLSSFAPSAPLPPPARRSRPPSSCGLLAAAHHRQQRRLTAVGSGFRAGRFGRCRLLRLGRGVLSEAVHQIDHLARLGDFAGNPLQPLGLGFEQLAQGVAVAERLRVERARAAFDDRLGLPDRAADLASAAAPPTDNASPPAVGDSPDRAVAVLADQQRAVMRDGDPDRTTPDSAVADDEAGQEILVFTSRLPILEQDADHLVAGPLRAVPGTVEGGEGLAAIFEGKLCAIVEGHFERSRMRLHQHIRYSDTAAQIWPFARVTGVFVAADIKPGPTVKGAFAHPGHIIRREVVAEAVALVGRAPQLAGSGLHRHPDAIAQTGRKDPFVLALGSEDEHVGALLLRTPQRGD